MSLGYFNLTKNSPIFETLPSNLVGISDGYSVRTYFLLLSVWYSQSQRNIYYDLKYKYIGDATTSRLPEPNFSGEFN